MKSFIYLASLLPAILGGQAITQISDSQADAIVADDMAAKKAQREAETPDLNILQRRQVDLGSHTLKMDNVVPPSLEPRAPEATNEELTPEQRQALFDKFKMISATATVFDDSITYLRWQDAEGRQYVGWSNANFNLLRTVQEFKEGDQNYRLAIMILSESSEVLEERRRLAQEEGIDLQLPDIPVLPEREDGVAEYFMEAEDRSIFQNEDAFEGMDALHALYNRNLDRLIIAHENSQKLAAARKRYESENPEPKESRLIHWRNE